MLVKECRKIIEELDFLKKREKEIKKEIVDRENHNVVLVENLKIINEGIDALDRLNNNQKAQKLLIDETEIYITTIDKIKKEIQELKDRYNNIKKDIEDYSSVIDAIEVIIPIDNI